MTPSAAFLANVGPGRVLGGKYLVERRLGHGGMGIVFAARHVELDTPVAIKILRSDVMDDAEVVARFTREAQAASRLRSDHAVRVTDVGRLEGGVPFMVMELLEGEDLAALLGRVGMLPVSSAVDCILQACEALAEAHANGLVHRDIKPSNLFLARRIDGRPLVKVLDFGIAKATTPLGAGGAVTTTQSIVGSPLYMSPEQMRTAKDVDHRTDIWSLGVCLYELLCGQAPFAAETLPEVCSKVMTGWVTPASELRPEVPETLSRVVTHCLAKAPEDRFQDVGELSRTLEEFASLSSRGSGERVTAVLASLPRIPIGGSSGKHPSIDPLADTRSARPFATTGRPGVSHAGLAVALAGAVGLGLVALAAFVIARNRLAVKATSVPMASVSQISEVVAETNETPAPPPSTIRDEPVSRPIAAVPSTKPRASAHPNPTTTAVPTPPPPPPSPPQPPTPVATLSPPAAPVEPPSPPPAPPAPTLDPSRGRVRWSVSGAGGGATTGDVAHALAHASGAWTSCYEAGLRARNAPVEGRGTLQLSCDDSGLVVDAKLSGIELPGLATCMRAAAVGSRIPNADTGTAWATVSLSFQIEK